VPGGDFLSRLEISMAEQSLSKAVHLFGLASLGPKCMWQSIKVMNGALFLSMFVPCIGLLEKADMSG
jgi:hypothetical protein